MILTFKAGSEIVVLNLNREKKIAIITSKMTNYKPTPVEWKMIFDKGKEKEQEEITDKLDDRQFREVLKLSMIQKGYHLIKNEL